MKIFSLYIVVIIAVVSADVSYFQDGAEGYNYPANPQPAFQESLASYTEYQPTSLSQHQSAYYQPQFQNQPQSQYPSQYQYELQSFYQPPQQYTYEYFPGYQYFPPGSQGITNCPEGTIGEYSNCEFPTPDFGFRPEKQGASGVSQDVLKSLVG